MCQNEDKNIIQIVALKLCRIAFVERAWCMYDKLI